MVGHCRPTRANHTPTQATIGRYMPLHSIGRPLQADIRHHSLSAAITDCIQCCRIHPLARVEVAPHPLREMINLLAVQVPGKKDSRDCCPGCLVQMWPTHVTAASAGALELCVAQAQRMSSLHVHVYTHVCRHTLQDERPPRHQGQALKPCISAQTLPRHALAYTEVKMRVCLGT